MKDIDKNSIDELLIRYLTGIADENELVEAENWINSSEANETYYQKFKSVWEISSDLKEYEELDTESSLKNVKKRIDFNAKSEAKIKPLWIAVRVAAVLVISLGLYMIFNKKDDVTESMKMVKIESGNEIKTITLPDQSVVTMNLASVIEYPENFEGNERKVKFEGEAYFEVTPDKLKPFIIETGKSQTRVVGTAFNLKALKSAETESIVVTEGIVEFSGKTEETNKPVKLVKGERAVLDSELKKEENTDPNFMAWKTGILIFEEQSLPKALKVLSDYYQVNLLIGDSVLNGYTLNGHYEKLSLEQLKEVLEMTLNLKINEEKGNIYRLKIK